MTRCLDEAKLQSYFDGELSLDMMESVTSHLASCATCAAAARELEEESALVMSALAAEFETSVPTERLRERIDAAVLGERLAVAEATQKTETNRSPASESIRAGNGKQSGCIQYVVELELSCQSKITNFDWTIVNLHRPSPQKQHPLRSDSFFF